MAKSNRETLLERLPSFLKKEPATPPAPKRRKGEPRIGPKPEPSLQEKIRIYLKECAREGTVPIMSTSRITRYDQDFSYLRNADLSGIVFPPQTNFNGMNLCGTTLRLPADAQINHTAFGYSHKARRNSTLMPGSAMPRRSHVFNNDYFNSRYIDGLQAIEGLDAEPRYRPRLRIPVPAPAPVAEVEPAKETKPTNKVSYVRRYKQAARQIDRNTNAPVARAKPSIEPAVEIKPDLPTPRMIRMNRHFGALGFNHSQESIAVIHRLTGGDIAALNQKLQKSGHHWLMRQQKEDLTAPESKSAYALLEKRFLTHIQKYGESGIAVAQQTLEKLSQKSGEKYAYFHSHKKSWLNLHQPERKPAPPQVEAVEQITEKKRAPERGKKPGFVSPMAAWATRASATSLAARGTSDARSALDELLAEDAPASASPSAAAIRDQILEGTLDGPSAKSARASARDAILDDSTTPKAKAGLDETPPAPEKKPRRVERQEGNYRNHVRSQSVTHRSR